MSDNIHTHFIQTDRCGTLMVYVQGDLFNENEGEKGDDLPVFLTVHDVGKNHSSWINFVSHPSMSNISKKVVFVHVDLLGPPERHEFPSLQYIAEDLIIILDDLQIKSCIILGDGAGANIALRFLATPDNRCLGGVLINSTAKVARLLDHFKESLHGHFPHMPHSTHDYIVLHRFGHKLEDIKTNEELTKAVEEYRSHIHQQKVNKHNSKLYAEAFLDRDDISNQISWIVINMLQIWGSRSPFAHGMDSLLSLCNLDEANVTSLKVVGIGDVLEEAPEMLANSLLLFCKRLGFLKSLATAGIERHRTCSLGSSGRPISSARRRLSNDVTDF